MAPVDKRTRSMWSAREHLLTDSRAAMWRVGHSALCAQNAEFMTVRSSRAEKGQEFREARHRDTDSG